MLNCNESLRTLYKRLVIVLRIRCYLQGFILGICLTEWTKSHFTSTAKKIKKLIELADLTRKDEFSHSLLFSLKFMIQEGKRALMLRSVICTNILIQRIRTNTEKNQRYFVLIS